MRIIFEPTGDYSNSILRRDHSPKVSIEYPDDDMDLNAVINDLVIPALIGWGFHPGSVMEALNPDYNAEIDCGNENSLDKTNWD
jgi:hypothetical protein